MFRILFILISGFLLGHRIDLVVGLLPRLLIQISERQGSSWTRPPRRQSSVSPFRTTVDPMLLVDGLTFMLPFEIYEVISPDFCWRRRLV